jgi:transposase
MKTYRLSSLSPDRDRAAKERRRLEAAKLFKQGLPQADIARRLKVSSAAVSQWHSIWQEKGLKGLYSLGKSGPKSKLTDEKLSRIEDILLQGPKHAGYGTDIWNLKRIKTVIKKKIGVSYGTTHIWRILTIQLGWSSQKPETRVRERDEEKIRRWKRWAWPQIKKGRKIWEPV